jgi:hypothetical protein
LSSDEKDGKIEEHKMKRDGEEEGIGENGERGRRSKKI